MVKLARWHGSRSHDCCHRARASAQLLLQRAHRHLILLVNQIVDLELQHALTLFIIHACNQHSLIIHSIAERATLRTIFEVRTTLTNLLIELRANFTVNVVQILVSKSHVPDISIRVEESVVQNLIATRVVSHRTARSSALSTQKLLVSLLLVG